MPRISEFFGIVISMYYNDHEPPHFHVSYAEHEAVVTIGAGACRVTTRSNSAIGLVHYTRRATW